KGGLQHPIIPMIAIVTWIAEQDIPAPQQAKIHAPGIYADARKILTMGYDRPAQSLLEFGKQPEDIPIERVQYLHRLIGKAVDILQPYFLAVEKADNASPTLRPQIKRQKLRFPCHVALSPDFRFSIFDFRLCRYSIVN